MKSGLSSRPADLFKFNRNSGTVTDLTEEGKAHFKRNVVIPNEIDGNSVKSIGDGAFYNNQLTSVEIPDSVKIIGNSAFQGNQLEKVTIPDNVTSIGNGAFSWEEGKPSLEKPGSGWAGKWTKEDANAEAKWVKEVDPADLFDFNKDSGTVIRLTDTGKTYFNGNVVIPNEIDGNSVKSIGDGAFSNNQLTSLILGSSVTSIGDGAFYRNQLTSVEIPDSVKIIGNSAFQGNQLEKVTIPNSVISIGHSAFQENKLTSLTLGNSVKSIGDGAFSNNQLTSLILGSSVTSIGNGAFWGNRLTEVIIPNSVTSIGNSAFSWEGGKPSLPTVKPDYGWAGKWILNDDKWAKQ